jgi:hypothetical protein
MSAQSTAAADVPEALDAKPIDLWDAWLFAEAEASLALAVWTDAPWSDKARAHAAYAAALDREEQAARVLARCLGEQPAATNSSWLQCEPGPSVQCWTK